LGIIGTAFTLVYAIAGLPLGRMADTGSRSKLMGWGLAVWSGLTAVNGMVGSFWSFLIVRMGVGIGEASYAPAANSLIGDLFPAHRRARAMGIFMLGLPLGLLLAFFTIGAMVKAFDSWRAPFFIAAVPGLILAIFMFFIKEPKRGAAESVQVSQEKIDRPIRRVLAVPTFLWLVMAGLCFNFATYACNSFLVPMLQRYFLMPLQEAAVATGVIVGVTGLFGLTLGGWVADKIHQRVANGRSVVCSVQPDHFNGVHRVGAAFRAHRDRRVRRGVQSGLVVCLQLLYLRLHGDSGRGRAALAGDGHGAVLRRTVSVGRRSWAGSGRRVVRSLRPHGDARGGCRTDD
jgi:MFS family permease